MLLTAELRLWWRRRPDALERLFEGLDCETRTDFYLLDPGQTEAGIKLRGGGGVEIKLLVARLGRTALGRSEIWVKSRSPALKLEDAPTVALRKARRTRLFRTDGGRMEEVQRSLAAEELEGCSVEFTTVSRQDRPEPWWTLGFEAPGTLDDVESTLESTVEELSKQIPAACIGESICASYPQWLAEAADS